MPGVAVTNQEFLWREWVLGEGSFADAGRRDPASRRLTGAPPRIPDPWWERLEEFLTRRDDHLEQTTKPSLKKRAAAKLPKPRVDGALQLTAHFHIREFACHDGRQVPKIAVPALHELCELLEQMRDTFGPALVLSGYRPADYNRRIGGARYSQHIYELSPDSVAADLVFRTGTPGQWYALADRLGAGGAGLYTRSGFVHVDNRPGRARWSG